MFGLKCVSLSNQKCMIQPTLINLHPNEYSQEFHFYPFVVKLDRCVGSCNTLKNRTGYYFDDIMRGWDLDIDIDFNGILLDEKLYKEKKENILIYDILYKTSTGAKPLRIRYDKIDGYIKIRDKIRYLVLFDDWCDNIYDRIKYLRSKKRGITDSINHNFGITRIYSFDSLPIEKILTFHKIIKPLKSVVDKNKNEYYYNIFL